MRNSKLQIKNHHILICILHFVLCVFSTNAQSNDQNYPTPITGNEIGGAIRARDVGDARLTSYFYAFNGTQGDVFINVVTSNFNGDVDVFALDGLRSLTKIVVFADASDNETGRVIYLRKPEKLLLRVEGRSPNDDAATFRIKFAGSFLAISDAEKTEQPALPEVKSSNESGVRVNSVGTIIEVKPKSTPQPVESIAEKDEAEGAVKEISVETEEEKMIVAETLTEGKKEAAASDRGKLEVIVTEDIVQLKKDNTPEAAEIQTEVKEETVKEIAEVKTADEIKAAEAEKSVSASETRVRTKKARNERAKKAEKPKKPNPLENVRLIVLFKDGSKIERPMTEVVRVNVDNRAILTIVSKDGSIGRYPIADVAKVTIE